MKNRQRRQKLPRPREDASLVLDERRMRILYHTIQASQSVTIQRIWRFLFARLRIYPFKLVLQVNKMIIIKDTRNKLRMHRLSLKPLESQLAYFNITYPNETINIVEVGSPGHVTTIFIMPGSQGQEIRDFERSPSGKTPVSPTLACLAWCGRHWRFPGHPEPTIIVPLKRVSSVLVTHAS